MSATSTIYVLHFDPPYRAPIGATGRVKTAGHYVGSTGGDVHARIARHLRGEGSPLVRAAVAAGCAVTIAATFAGGRDAERAIKRTHHRERWCPICTPRALTVPPSTATKGD